MIKVDGIVDNAKKIRSTKYFISAAPDNKTRTVTVNGAELIPIDLGGRLVAHPTISINELGKKLLQAAAAGNIDDIKTLLTKGAPFTTDWLGTSPLHIAVLNNHLEITEMLLRAGISKDAKTKVERTPLHMAAYEGHLQIVDTLVKHGADINCRDMLKMTPLHWAVQNGHLDIVAYLINNGAEVELQNKFNLTALQIAQQINRSDIEEYITNSLTNPAEATQNLVIQLAMDDVMECNSGSQGLEERIIDLGNESSNHESIVIPIEPDIMAKLEPVNSEVEDDSAQSGECVQELDPDSIDEENTHLIEGVRLDPANFKDSLKLLQEHGITILQTDENEDGNILNTVMESGHSVVLTDIGKEVLDSVKQSEQRERQLLQKSKTEEPKAVQIRHHAKNKFSGSKVVNMKNKEHTESVSHTDMEMVLVQLVEAKRTIEEMQRKMEEKGRVIEEQERSLKLRKRKIEEQEKMLDDKKRKIEEKETMIRNYEAELNKQKQGIERYKMQLKLLMEEEP